MSTPQPERAERVQSAPPSSSLPPIGIHITREELRAIRLAELAKDFESAFEVPA